MMPNLRIKSSHRRLLVLLACTFLVGTMITIVNYNQNINQQHFVLSDNDRTALLNYFKYSHLKRNLVSESPIINEQIDLIQHDQHNKLKSIKNQFKQSNSPISSSLISEQSISLNKISSTTFSDNKESSTRFLINRDNRDVDSKDNQEKQFKINQINNKQLNDFKKPITHTPSISQDKSINLTNSTHTKINQSPNKQQISINNKQNLTIKSTPVYVHSSAELNLTQKFIIDKKDFCSKDHGYGLDLLVMVITSPPNFDARSAIRQTWGGFAVERGSKLLFVVGKSPQNEINDKLLKEDIEHEDILQAEFQDAYYNLTLKSLAIVNWVAENCERAKYILKIDDDMFVNMQLLVDFAETREFKNVIIGKIAKKWLPHRSPSKWFVPKSAYSNDVYPNFATGPAYLIHRDAIPNLSKVIKSNATKVIKLEDVFLTGIVAEKAGVRRLNYSLFKNSYFDVNKCNFMRFITSHQHSPKEIIRLWQLVYSDRKVDCNVKKPAAKLPISQQKPKTSAQSPVQIKKQSPSDKTKPELKIDKKN